VTYANFKLQNAKIVVLNMKANPQRYFQIPLNVLALVEKEESNYKS